MYMSNHIMWVSVEQGSTVLYSSKYISDITHHNNTRNSQF